VAAVVERGAAARGAAAAEVVAAAAEVQAQSLSQMTTFSQKHPRRSQDAASSSEGSDEEGSC
tara:strand:+ start:306 stop:491 length:186 start_codon:yes stop_codon:yes gene_type:complete